MILSPLFLNSANGGKNRGGEPSLGGGEQRLGKQKLASPRGTIIITTSSPIRDGYRLGRRWERKAWDARRAAMHRPCAPTLESLYPYLEEDRSSVDLALCGLAEDPPHGHDLLLAGHPDRCHTLQSKTALKLCLWCESTRRSWTPPGEESHTPYRVIVAADGISQDDEKGYDTTCACAQVYGCALMTDMLDVTQLVSRQSIPTSSNTSLTLSASVFRLPSLRLVRSRRPSWWTYPRQESSTSHVGRSSPRRKMRTVTTLLQVVRQWHSGPLNELS